MSELTMSTPFVAPDVEGDVIPTTTTTTTPTSSAPADTPDTRTTPTTPTTPRPPDLAPARPAPPPGAMPVTIEAWPDPVIDQLGHDPRSAYVERFWLGILGPSTIVLLRRLAAELDEHPDGLTLDLVELSRAIGVGMKGGRQSAFMRTVDRARRFGGLRWQAPGQLAVRRKLAPLTRAQLNRLPPTLQDQHETWVATAGRPLPGDDVNRLRERARGLALSLLELGEDPASAEQQLHRWRFHPALAHEALHWAVEQRRSTGTTAVTRPTGPPPLDAA